MTKKDREVLRIICGNQLAIMQSMNTPVTHMRIREVKQWWKDNFNESVGPRMNIDTELNV